MYGISVFLGDALTTENLTYIKKMAAVGFEGIFTSLHIPEDDASLYLERLKSLGEIAKEKRLQLMVDISGEALDRAGLSFDRIDEIKALGVTGLRMDYAISNEKIAALSHQLSVGLNASTITEKDIVELTKYHADFENFEAWHNYYPRPETGLDYVSFKNKNKWLQEKGFKVYAFTPGNEQLRGPLYEGLPTLEDHRYGHPLACGIEMISECHVDAVYVGDPTLTKRTINQFDSFINKNRIVLEAEDIGSQFFELVLGNHQNRQDDARDVVRSAEARFKKIEKIEPEFMLERTVGTITIDNSEYGRYMGEIQLLKKDLPKNEKINVVARVVREDWQLIKMIKGGTNYFITRKGFLEDEFREFDDRA